MEDQGDSSHNCDGKILLVQYLEHLRALWHHAYIKMHTPTQVLNNLSYAIISNMLLYQNKETTTAPKVFQQQWFPCWCHLGAVAI